MKYRLRKTILTFLFLIVGVVGVYAQITAGGDLDSTFAGTGKVRLGFGGGDDIATSTAVQTDGKLVVAGAAKNGSAYGFAVTRYNADGAPDYSFGRGGKVFDAVGYDGNTIARSVKIQADGKIVVGGTTAASGSALDFAIIRLNADGSLDPTFATNGRRIVPVGPGADDANAMAIQTDGKIILAGYSAFPGSSANCSLIRLNVDGSLDSTFDGDGIVVTDLSTNGDAITSIVLYGTKIIAAGYSFHDFAAIRYNSDGSLDTTFDTDGIVVSSFGPDTDRATGIAIQPGNAGLGVPDRIVLGGFDDNPVNRNFAAVRYNLNGTLDTSFDTDGLVSIATGSFDLASGLLIQASGPTLRKIILTGTSGFDFQVMKLNINGTLDTAFDGDGIVKTSMLTYDEGAASVFMGGRIVVAGTSRADVNLPGDFATARYDLANGSLDTTYNGIGTKLFDVGNFYNTSATSTAIDPAGRIVVAGFLAEPFGSTSLSGVMRFNSDGTLDTSFSSDGMVVTSMNDTRAVAVQSDAKIVIAGSFVSGANRDFGLIRLNSDGSHDISAAAAIGPGNAFDQANALAIQPDGKMLVAGFSAGDFALVRFNTNGTLDGSFDGDGKVVTDIGTGTDNATSIAVMADGRTVVGGSAGGNFAAARYNSDGSLDTTFSFDGKVTTPVISQSVANSATLQHDGKVILAGYTFDTMSSQRVFALVRYNLNGSLDTSFDGDGIVTTAIGASDSFGHAAKIQSDGKIVVAGSSFLTNMSSFVVVRYNTDGSLDSSFAARSHLYGANGVVLVNLSGLYDSANAIALDGSGNAVVAGNAGNLFGVARILDGIGPTVASVSVSGRVITSNGNGLRNAIVTLTDADGVERRVLSGSLGYFRFDGVVTGQTYAVRIISKQFSFAPRILTVTDSVTELEFVPE